MVVGVDDEDGQEARRFAVTRVLTHSVMRARIFIPGFADPVDLDRLIVNLAANGAGEYTSVDEG